jgi:hypothetical protein
MKNLKIFLLIPVNLLISAILLAQAVPVSTKIEKENRNAVMIEINQPVDITTDALEQKLQRSGLKDKIRNGTGSYKGVTLSEISNDKIDLYTKVEKGANNTSLVYMAVSKGYNNFTNSGADSAITEKVQAYLNSFVKDANNHFADVDISNQIKGADKSEKELNQLLDEQKDLQKKKAKIDGRLLEIENELSAKRVEIGKKQTGVTDSKTKRTNDQ